MSRGQPVLAVPSRRPKSVSQLEKGRLQSVWFWVHGDKRQVFARGQQIICPWVSPL